MMNLLIVILIISIVVGLVLIIGGLHTLLYHVNHIMKDVHIIRQKND